MTLSIASRRLLLASVTCAALSACATPPDLDERPQLAAPESLQTKASLAAPVSAWPSDRWWESYGDAQLNALIEEAVADSPSLAAAAARLDRARAQAQEAGAARMPSINAQTSLDASRRRLSADNLPDVIRNAVPDDWSTQSSAQATIQYQLDFFGKNRANFAAATSRTRAAEAEAASARLQLSTAVALAYADFTRLNADRAALEEGVRLREASLELVSQRVGAGLENDGQGHQARAELSQARTDLFAVEAAILRARHQLAALLGKGPDRGLQIDIPRSLTLNSVGLPAHVELDLIGRRPDLVAARLRAEAAAHRIDSARADFYPNINLGAVIGLQTLGFDRLGGGETSFAQFGPAASLPIFNGGRIEGAYRGARAEYDEAVALYNQSLTEALRDVADAISERRSLEEQLAEQRVGLSAARAAYRVARLRYQAGLLSYIDTLASESELISQRRAVADLESRAFSLDVTLVRALGGGFSAT
ncbi:MAG: efflux transporter outer membrane subunit [Hyphomonadaceae bacterium]